MKQDKSNDVMNKIKTTAESPSQDKSNDVMNKIKTTAESPSQELLDFVKDKTQVYSSKLQDILKPQTNMQRHEHCEVGVLKRHTGPHTGELVCVDTMCNHKGKHIKWTSKKEYNDIKDIIKNEDTQR